MLPTTLSLVGAVILLLDIFAIVSYVSAPRGYVLVHGYRDYSLGRHGVPFRRLIPMRA